MGTLDDLPDSVLLSVLENLSPTDLLAGVALVNRRLRHLVTSEVGAPADTPGVFDASAGQRCRQRRRLASFL